MHINPWSPYSGPRGSDYCYTHFIDEETKDREVKSFAKMHRWKVVEIRSHKSDWYLKTVRWVWVTIVLRLMTQGLLNTPRNSQAPPAAPGKPCSSEKRLRASNSGWLSSDR